MKTITHILITHAVLLVLFGGAALVFAQDAESTVSEIPPPQRQERMEERSAAIEARTDVAKDRQAEVVAATEERRAQLQVRAQGRITNLAANMSNRLEAVISRMQNITDRLQTRIHKLDEAGMETSEASVALAAAQTSLDAAKTALVDIDTKVAGVVGAVDVKTAWADVRVIYTTAREHLQSTHSELRKTVNLLKTATPKTAPKTPSSDITEETPIEATTTPGN